MEGYDLIITGRRKEKLESLSNILSENEINVEVIISELSNDAELSLLSERLK